jgi:hypothetical protein
MFTKTEWYLICAISLTLALITYMLIRYGGCDFEVCKGYLDQHIEGGY